MTDKLTTNMYFGISESILKSFSPSYSEMLAVVYRRLGAPYPSRLHGSSNKRKRIMDCFAVENGTDVFYQNFSKQVRNYSCSISGRRVARLVFVRKKKIRRRRNVYSMGFEGDEKEFLKLNDQRKHFYQKLK